MATQFRCIDSRRSDAVRSPVDDAGNPIAPQINGIDYLEVAASQRSLIVHFIHPLPGQPGGVPAGAPALGPENVVIEGGVRVTSIRVQDVTSAGNAVTVTVDRPGDFSTYRLRLAESASDRTVPAGFDTQLATVDFSFKVDCPSDFDCGHRGACPAPVLAGPVIDYLAKDYASFRQLMLDRLAVVMPGWTERSPADIGVTLVELLAYAGDQLSYQQDSVATEAYIGTARRRTSIRRHARLVDYSMHDGCSARAWVCVEVRNDLLPGVGDRPILPAGSIFLTRGEGPAGLDEADLERALSAGALAFESVHPVAALTVARNEIEFYTWGDVRCCLPAGATRATLDCAADDVDLVSGDVLVFEEVLGPESGEEADADPSHRHAVRLDRAPVEVEDRLTGQKVLEIAWHLEDALREPLCLWEVLDASGARRKASLARANVVLVDHGLTRRGTADAPGLAPAVVPDERRYRPLLADVDITHRVPYDAAAARRRSAAAALATAAADARPAVELVADGELWRPVRELLATDRFDPRFVVETESDGRAFLRFGDGVRGRQPSRDTAFVATYRVGTGTAGNVGADAIARLVRPDGIGAGEVVRVWNPIAATGGAAPEPMERVRQHAGQAFRTQQRAVTDQDYAAAADRHPEVQRAAATRRWTGSWHTVFVTTDRRRGARVDAPFETDLRDFLERFRMAGHDLEIDAPRYVPLDIAITVCARDGNVRADVEQALLEEFSARDLPDGRRGFFHPDRFTFGQAVYLSRIVAAAMSLPGVAWVDVDDSGGKPNRFRRWGEPARGEIAAGEIAMQRLEIARLDNDPNRPENGRIEFFMSGGL